MPVEWGQRIVQRGVGGREGRFMRGQLKKAGDEKMNRGRTRKGHSSIMKNESV